MKLSRELLHKFGEGNCSPEEEKIIQEWLNDGSSDLDEGNVSLDIKKNIWQKLEANIHFPAKVARMSPRYQLLKIAAIIIVVVSSAALFYFIKSGSSSSEITYMTNAHEQKRIFLSDSSVVFLSPSSMIKVTQPFPDDRRDIQLSGEAFFEVAKDPSKPFTVITNNIRTTALGTSFKVTSFPDKNNISVALSYGRVLVQNHRSNRITDSFYLAPGEEIDYNKINKKIEKTKLVEKHLSYKNNILYFKDAGIKEVVSKLEEFYDLKVKYDSLKDVKWRVSGEFDYEPVEIVMENIAFSCNINYKLIGDTLILKPNKAIPGVR